MAFNNNDEGTRDRGPDEDELESYEPPYDAEQGCPKCGCPETRVSEMATQGGTASMALDVPGNFFKVVTCLGCGYSELYKVGGHGDAEERIVETFLE